MALTPRVGAVPVGKQNILSQADLGGNLVSSIYRLGDRGRVLTPLSASVFSCVKWEQYHLLSRAVRNK